MNTTNNFNTNFTYFIYLHSKLYTNIHVHSLMMTPRKHWKHVCVLVLVSVDIEVVQVEWPWFAMVRLQWDKVQKTVVYHN